MADFFFDEKTIRNPRASVLRPSINIKPEVALESIIAMELRAVLAGQDLD